MSEIKFADFKAAVKELNGLNIEGIASIRTVGIKREVMEDKFLDAIEKIAEDGEDEKLTDTIIEMNNALLDSVDPNTEAENDEAENDETEGDKESEETEEPEETEEQEEPEEPEAKPTRRRTSKPAAKPAAKKPAAKKPAAKKTEPKAPKAPAERSCYDHIPGKQTGILDECLREGNTVADICKEAGVKRARVMAHVKYLRDNCGLTLVETKSKGDDRDLDVYKFKEKIYRKP